MSKRNEIVLLAIMLTLIASGTGALATSGTATPTSAACLPAAQVAGADWSCTDTALVGTNLTDPNASYQYTFHVGSGTWTPAKPSASGVSILLSSLANRAISDGVTNSTNDTLFLTMQATSPHVLSPVGKIQFSRSALLTFAPSSTGDTPAATAAKTTQAASSSGLPLPELILFGTLAVAALGGIGFLIFWFRQKDEGRPAKPATSIPIVINQPLAPSSKIYYKNQPIATRPALGGGFVVDWTSKERPDAALFSIVGQEQQYKGTGVLPAARGSTGYTLTIAPVSHKLAIQVLDAKRQPVPRVELQVISNGRAETVRPTDDAGRSSATVPPGQARVALASAYSTLEAERSLNVTGDAPVELVVRVRPLGALAAAPPLVTPPAGVARLRLVDVVNQMLGAYATAMRTAYDDPVLHLQDGARLARAFEADVPSTIAEMHASLEDLFREKQVQAHATSAQGGVWSGAFAFHAAPLVLPTLRGGPAAIRAYASTVDQRRARLEEERVRGSAELLARPALRIEELTQALLKGSMDGERFEHVFAADAVLDVLDLYLHDAQLATEWKR